MGFEEKLVKQALIVCENSKDKAIEYIINALEKDEPKMVQTNQKQKAQNVKN